jgi:hypothetical protein
LRRGRRNKIAFKPLGNRGVEQGARVHWPDKSIGEGL